MPAALSDYCVVDRSAPEDMVATIQGAIATQIANKEAGLKAAQRVSPVMQRATLPRQVKSSLLERSAWGLAVTVVVAGIAAPAIDGRAAATSAVDPEPATVSQVAALSAAQSAAGGAEVSASSEAGRSQRDAAGASNIEAVRRSIPVPAVADGHLEPPPLAELLDHIDADPSPAQEVATAFTGATLLAPVTASLDAPAEVDVTTFPDSVAIPSAGPKGGAEPGDMAGDPHSADALNRSKEKAR